MLFQYGTEHIAGTCECFTCMRVVNFNPVIGIGNGTGNTFVRDIVKLVDTQKAVDNMRTKVGTVNAGAFYAFVHTSILSVIFTWR